MPRISERRRRRSNRRHDDGREPLPREAWTRLAACTAAAALLQLDGTVITVALPSVAHDLHISNSSTATILSAYFGSYALMLFPGGRLVDKFGARHVALLGLVIFAIGAALGAVVSDLGLLVATRVIQGVGAGLVSPAALAGAVSGFPPERRGSALGIWGASAGISNLLGPLIGGVLTVAFDWRAAWWVLVPLALATAAGILRYLPSIVHEVGEQGRESVMNPIVTSAAFVAALTFVVMIGTFYLAEQYLQKVAGFSALGASSVLVIVAFLVGFAAPMAGVLSDRRGERVAASLGFLGCGVGMAVLAIPGVTLDGLVTVIPLIPVGLGLGMLFVPVSRAAINATPPESHGRTSSVLSFSRLLGAAIGAGLAGAALSGGASADTVHTALGIAAALCLLAGLPVSGRLGGRRAPEAVPVA